MNVKRKKLFHVLTVILSLLLVLSISAAYAAQVYEGFLNEALGINTTRIVQTGEGADTEYYKPDYASIDEFYDAKMAHIRETVREGVVLLKNDQGALPISAGSNVTFLGHSSTLIVQGIAGGASQIPLGRSDDIVTVMQSVGVNVNPTVYDFYANAGTTPSYNENMTIAEVPVSTYTDAVRSSYASYHDAAFVVISRSSGEGRDVSLDPASVADGDGVHHGLQLQDAEREVIAEAKANFDRVIVLLNTDYAMEIDELKYDDQVDAILWIGGTGYNGIYGVADVLVGASPSGGLADTYAVSVSSSPAAQTYGDSVYTNIDADLMAHYIIYKEGIYVGYKYYETRYEDTVLGRYNASSSAGVYGGEGTWNYSGEVSYSFGYGLSYTTFTEEIEGFSVDGTTAKMQVKVTNTGAVEGKHAVQVYAQSPYTDYDIANKVEKAAVQLMGFQKTGVLKSGDSEVLTIEMDLHDLASYDYTNAKTYIMEKGDYYFAIGNGAHDALNNILAAKGKTTADGMDYDGDAGKAKVHTMAADDFETYSVSRQTGYAITNRLGSADLNYYGDFVTYLSRSDWQATWPVRQQLTATEQMEKDLQNGSTYTATEATAEDQAKMVYGSRDTAYTLIMMKGQPFDSPYWDDLINQMSLHEMGELIGAGLQTTICESISYNDSTMRDGPAGPSANYSSGTHKNESAVMYESEVVLASTFDPKQAAKQGAIFGNDALFTGTAAIWAPGCNTHRVPMSGRNSEYFSEDGVLTATMASALVDKGLEYGLIFSPKHFVFNDQDTHRNGLSTFMNEQEAREIMLRGFEEPMSRALGTMSAYNRVGCVYSSAHVGLMTEILRNEWGYKGYVITDAVGSRQLSRYADGAASVVAGVTVFDCSVTNLYCGENGALSETAIISDPVLFNAVRKATHYNLYAFVNSNSMNGYSANMTIVHDTPYYQTAVTVTAIVLGALTLAAAAGYIFLSVKSGKEVKVSE